MQATIILCPLKFLLCDQEDCILKSAILNDEHGIAKTKEAISFLYCLLIGCHDMFPAGKGRNQHDKRGFRQMEIRDQSIDDLELISRIDEDIRPAALGM